MLGCVCQFAGLLFQDDADGHLSHELNALLRRNTISEEPVVSCEPNTEKYHCPIKWQSNARNVYCIGREGRLLLGEADSVATDLPNNSRGGIFVMTFPPILCWETKYHGLPSIRGTYRC